MLFRGDDLYDLNRALAIPNDTLKAMRISHPSLSGTQKSLYADAARSGKILTLDGAIEVRALVQHGVKPSVARQIVGAAADDLVAQGVRAVTWHPGLGPIV